MGELAYTRSYLIRTFGPERGGDPAALCREVLALFDLTPDGAAAQARTWRELPHHRIAHLRRIKILIRPLAYVRPHLADGDPPGRELARAVDAWSAVRPLLP